jgi:hypothetical protein
MSRRHYEDCITNGGPKAVVSGGRGVSKVVRIGNKASERQYVRFSGGVPSLIRGTEKVTASSAAFEPPLTAQRTDYVICSFRRYAQ